MARTLPIGSYRTVQLEVAVWDGVTAEVDLSVACLFEREPDGVKLGGGARHLDEALGGALTRLRRQGRFRARVAQTLVVRPAPGRVSAPRILVVGLGNPSIWCPDISGRASAAATDWAIRTGAHSVAFAPSLLDAGIAASGAAEAILTAVIRALDAAYASAAAGLGPRPLIERFVFDAGDAHAKQTAEILSSTLTIIAGGSRHDMAERGG